MAPSVTVGMLLVAMALLAGGAELYAQRRRRHDLRERFKLEYSSSNRAYDRLRRAEAALATRRERFERMTAPFAGQPAPTPILIPVATARDDAWQGIAPSYSVNPLATNDAD